MYVRLIGATAKLPAGSMRLCRQICRPFLANQYSRRIASLRNVARTSKRGHGANVGNFIRDGVHAYHAYLYSEGQNSEGQSRVYAKVYII